MQTNIEKTIQDIRGNLTQGEKSTFYKGKDMGARYSLACNKPASGNGGLTDAECAKRKGVWNSNFKP